MQILNSNTTTFRLARAKSHLLTTMASALALSLVACGGTGQDSQTAAANSSPTVFSGIALDGALARATVYLDSNNNATRDPWEDSAFTDNDGYYSYNPKTKTDYCASTANASQKIYCLASSRSYSNVVVRIDGGYDLLTGEPFIGSMSRRVDTRDSANYTDTVISPLTTLLTNVNTPTDRSQLLRSLSITERDLNINYLNTDGNGGINANLLNTSLKVHKTVTLLADRLNDNYSALNDEAGVLNEPSSEVYKNLARELSSTSSTSLNTVLSDSQSLLRVLDQSETTLRNLFDNKELSLPLDLGSVTSPNNFSRVISITQPIPNLVDILVRPLETDPLKVIGGTRALESLIIKSVNEGAQNDSTIDSAINFFTNSNNNYLMDVLVNNLASDKADLNGLAKNDFSGDDFDSVEEIEGASSLNESAIALSILGGKSLRVSDLDLGYGPNKLDDSEIEFYFKGNANDLDGSFDACVKYINNASSNGSLGDANTRGELVKGYWSLLGATQDNPSSYSVLLTIEFLGSTYQAILKPNGQVMVDNTSYQLIRFDFDGGIKNWHSMEGLTNTASVPSNNKQCEQRLPSRIGI